MEKIQESKHEPSEIEQLGQRVFGLVCRGAPDDFQQWLDTAKVYGLYVVFSKSTRTNKLVIVEEAW